MMRRVFLILACLLLASTAHAGTYWVSPRATETATVPVTWASCQSVTPLAGASACNLYTANQNAQAGDTVYLRGGTYTYTSGSGCGSNYTCGIAPKNRGTLVNRITYRAYQNEIPVITTDGTAPTYTVAISIIQGTVSEPTYIRVLGITVHNMPNWVRMYHYASFNEIAYCRFYSDTGNDYSGAAGLSLDSACGGGVYGCASRHNWIHHNTFSKAHASSATAQCVEGADIIRIGNGWPTTDAAYNDSINTKDDYNTVEDNVLEYAGHTVLDTYGGYAVIARNFVHNEGWLTDPSNDACTYPTMPNGKYGHRGIQTSEDYGRAWQFVLVEGNRIGASAANPGNAGEGSLSLSSSATIVRYNFVYGGFQSGITTKWYRGFADGGTTTLTADIDLTQTTIPLADTTMLTSSTNYLRIGDEKMTCTGRTATSMTGCHRGEGAGATTHTSGATVTLNALANRGQAGNGPYNIRIYHNTSTYNGYTYPFMWTSQNRNATTFNTTPGKLAGLNVYSLALNIVAKNNIVYGNRSYTQYGRDITVDTGQDPASYPNTITATNNWTGGAADPLWRNAVFTRWTSTTLPDLTLQAGSPVINPDAAAMALTVANGAGTTSTTLIVDDALFFQDGTWGSDLARGVTLFPDEIAIGTVGNTVAISSINYATNTITLASAKTWADNAPIWLYKRGDGKVVLLGSAPDYGAHEYGMGVPAAPGAPVIR